MADAKAKGRARGARGAENAHCRLSPSEVAEIREKHVPGRGGNTAELAARFGISGQYVGQLSRGVWRTYE